jgi:hypothetical protein
VLSSTSQLLSVAGDGLFHAVTGTVTAAAGVSQVRIKLGVGPFGSATFDGVGLWDA